MSKLFLTLEEAKSALGKTEDQIKQFTREGRLREFRDGPKLMYKRDQVDALKADLGGQDQVDLGPSDSGAPIGMVDSKSASGTSISLNDSAGGQASLKEDTALAADLGLSGSVGGIPGQRSGSMAGRSGVNVFAGEEADPSAATVASRSGPSDQVSMEGVGSGSGLLDLTRESDDTSLGAVLDEIPTAGSTAGKRGLSESSGRTAVTAAPMEARAPRSSPISAPPVLVEAPDPSAPGFAGLAAGAGLFSLFGIFIVILAATGARPDFLKSFAGQVWMPFAIGLGVALVLFVVGFIIGKATTKTA